MVPLLRIDAITSDLPALLSEVGVPVGRPVVVIVGGAGGMDERAVAAFEKVFRQVVVPLVERLGAVVIDGGTDSGVMRSTGQVRAATRPFPLIGVAVAATVVEGTSQVADDAAYVEPNHSLMVLVPGAGWGDEVAWISAVASAVAQQQASVTMLVNGGEIAYEDAVASHARERPVLVLAGTGRTADAIADARSGQPADRRAVSVAASELTLIEAVDDLDAVRTALSRALRS